MIQARVILLKPSLMHIVKHFSQTAEIATSNLYCLLSEIHLLFSSVLINLMQMKKKNNAIMYIQRDIVLIP